VRAVVCEDLLTESSALNEPLSHQATSEVLQYCAATEADVKDDVKDDENSVSASPSPVGVTQTMTTSRAAAAAFVSFDAPPVNFYLRIGAIGTRSLHVSPVP